MVKELNFRDPGKLNAQEYYSLYEMPLARAFYAINQRGIKVDVARLQTLRDYVNQELGVSCNKISISLGGKRVIPQESAGAKGKTKTDPNTFNLSSSQQIIV